MQSFTEFELILVDDGSTDGSEEICDSYAAKDLRIIVFHTKNKGVSCARNLGLTNAHGEYILFVDSDDELPPNAIETLYNNKADFYIGGYLRKFSNYSTDYRPSNNRTYNEEEKEECLDIILPVKTIIDGPSAKLYKRSIINKNNLRFIESLNYGEDKLFVLEYLHHAKTIKTTTEIVYIQKRREGSLSSNISDYKHLKQIVNLLTYYVKVVEFYQKIYSCKSVNELYHIDVVQRYVYRYLHILRNLRVTSLSYKDLCFISHLIRKDKEPINKKDGRYINSCKYIAMNLPSCFLYPYILFLNILRI